MGACTSKKEGGNSGPAKFDKTGCASVDQFFKQAQDCANNFDTSMKQLTRFKEQFYSLTKFEMEPNQKIDIAMVGMMVLFATGVEDPSKLNVEAADKAPFFDLTVPKDVKDGNKMWDAFAGYSGCLDDIVREKLPKLMEEVQDLAGKAQGVGENATEEIDKLGAMQKAKAVMILPKNVKLL